MLLLASTSDKIRLTTDASCDVDVHASWVDLNGSTVTPGRTNTAITTATTTDLVASPASSTYRNVKQLTIRNAHATTAVGVTVIHTDGTTAVEVFKATLAAGQSLIYVEGAGWTVTVPLYQPVRKAVLHGDAGANFTMTNAANAERFAGNSTRHITLANGSGCSQIRLIGSIQVASASVNTPLVRLRYFTAWDATFANYLQAGASGHVEFSVFTGTAGTLGDTGWVDLAAGAKVDGIALALCELGGDAAADPALGATEVWLR
jgi:hypothetical protein